MNNSIIVKKIDKGFQSKYDSRIKEGIKVSLMSLGINISYFNINIDIKKDNEKKMKMLQKKVEQEQRIKEIMDRRNNIEVDYNLNNMLW